MPRIPISDLDDDRLAMYRDLKRTNLTRNSAQFVVEGEKLFERLLASPFRIDSVLVTERHEMRIASRLNEDVTIYVVPDAMIEQVVGFNFHRGVLACGHRLSWPESRVLAGSAGPRATFVVCPRIDNPENLGAIVRIADVFGVDAVVTGGRCPDPFSRRVLRVSMGSSLRVPVIASDRLADDIDQLRRDQRFVPVATVVDPLAEPLDGFQWPDRTLVFLGSEGHGLEPEWLALCEWRVTIPMRAGVESLNVSVAAGIVLYHVSRGGFGSV